MKWTKENIGEEKKKDESTGLWTKIVEGRDKTRKK